MNKDVSNKFGSDIYESISLSAYVSYFREEEELREIFLNMDRAMKYIHEKGYCIGSFNPRKIEILNNSIDQIRFDEILPMPNNYMERKNYIKEDIYNSSFIQIGLYSNCLSYLKRDFLKSNFNDFIHVLPADDVPYYRGVIERGASVYFSEYAAEKANRDLATLEQQLSGSGMSSNAVRNSSDGVNDKINDKIYKQISGKNDAAFISFLIFPTIILVVGVIFAIISLIISLS